MRKYVVRFMVFYILSIGCLLGIIIYSYQNKIDRHNEQVEREYPGVWKLSDEYDNRNSGYMEFLHQKNSLSILKKVYKELKKAELYREYSRQILSYHEYFRGNEKLASGSYNDKTEEGYLTNLTVLQMPEKMISEKKIEQHIEKGRCFTLKEYQRPLNQEIPLIAGYDYQKVFHLNQKIKVGYLGTENCTFKIIGFLHKNTRLSSELNLDETLIMPTVSKMKTMKQENEKNINSQ